MSARYGFRLPPARPGSSSPIRTKHHPHPCLGCGRAYVARRGGRCAMCTLDASRADDASRRVATEES